MFQIETSDAFENSTSDACGWMPNCVTTLLEKENVIVSGKVLCCNLGPSGIIYYIGVATYFLEHLMLNNLDGAQTPRDE